MLSKHTIIGLVVGSVIMGIGVLSLIQHIGTITIDEEHYVKIGESSFYTIPAPDGSKQYMKITGDSFNVTMSSPGVGLHIPESIHKNEVELDWVHLEDGETNIKIENIGNDELLITGTLIRSSDPIWFTYDLMVIISGMVIIGFSMGFTLRKPKGF